MHWNYFFFKFFTINLINFNNLFNFSASGISGFLAAFMSLPFDNAKIKFQKMKIVDGVKPYSNIFDCLYKVKFNNLIFYEFFKKIFNSPFKLLIKNIIIKTDFSNKLFL